MKKEFKDVQRSAKECRTIVGVLLLFTFHFSFFLSLQAQTAVGKWRSCLDFSWVNHVVPAGDCIYAGAKGGIFCYDLDDYTLTTMSKGDGLSDVGIATMDYDETTRCLVVAYNNSNVDILYDNHTYNLSDIKRSEIAGDKNIYHVRFAHGNAYLCTGFGVVVVDLRRMEVKETWYMGTGGAYSPVYDLAFMTDSLYAATGEGMKRLAATETHPSIIDRWTADHRLDSVSVFEMAAAGNHLLVAAKMNSSNQGVVYTKKGTGFVTSYYGKDISLHEANGRLTILRGGSVMIFDNALNYYGTRSIYQWGNLDANDAAFDRNGTLWVAHPWEGIIGIHFFGDYSEEYHHPDGPASGDHAYRLVPFNHRMMLCPGGHTTTYANAYLAPDLFTANGRQWSMLDKSNGMLDGMTDIVDAAVNPRDTGETVIAVWGWGVASIRDNKIVAFYDASNTGGALVPYTSGSYTRLNTGAVAFDHQGNLWVLNSHSTHALAVRRRNGSWESFSTMDYENLTTPSLDKLVWDSINNYLWFMGRENEIYVHDGKSRLARINPNRGSKMKTQSVTAMVQDHNGSLWIGTNKGIKVIYDGYNAFKNGGNGEVAPVNCSNITITNGEFAEYLMAYESITAIAVDGANRKWVGTANGGLYLLSSNGLEQLEHFTFANSPLFSDKIISLGINESSGEVYIGTDRGLQVYRGTATYATSEPLEEVYAFPNPVKPGYDGPIAIKGFTRNGRVHITDASGHTVFSTTANGGQAIWYGRNFKGEKVASGVYFVFASDDLGDNRSVAKILIIR